MKIFYLAFGSGLLLLFSSFMYFGWGASDSSEEVKGVPKSVRDNPGAYRVHYVGGK